MPELPEVETIRRGLMPRLIGQQIAHIETTSARIFQTSTAEMASRLPGQAVHVLTRRGKFLLFHLDRDVLIIHLGMTGQLTLRNPDQPDSPRFLRQPVTGLQRVRQHPADRHTHFQVFLLDGRTLMLRDPRMFGKVILVPRGGDAVERLFQGMGPEPLSEEYTLEWFLTAIRKRSRVKIKALLLDQGFVAGLGNIYADEALFEAGVHPAKRVRYLRRAEKVRIFEAIPSVLKKGIQFGGTSLRDYINSDGEVGTNQDELMVYGREGEPCPRCGTRISRIVIAQRSTHFCPSCQRR